MKKQKTKKQAVLDMIKDKSLDVESLVDEFIQAHDELDKAKEEVEKSKNAAQRSLADYQNLVRRSQEDRVKFVKMANTDLIEALLQPIEHLGMAAVQLKDSGLDMVVGQFQKTLTEFGLQEIEVMGKEFDIDTMEVVEKKDKAQKVVKIIAKGYRLNGEVIQHAKVVLG